MAGNSGGPWGGGGTAVMTMMTAAATGVADGALLKAVARKSPKSTS